MMIKLIFLIFLIQNLNYQCNTLETNLKLVQIIFRHGDRTPVFVYPLNPNNITIWDKYGGLGQLTQVGMRQLYDFGRFLRRNYKEFLNEFYNNFEIDAISTDYDRTIMSTSSLLAGLFEPVDYQKFKENINWQPIPIRMNTQRAKKIFNTDSCPKLSTFTDKSFHRDEYKEFINDNKNLVEFLKEKLGLDNFNFGDVWPLGDTLFIERIHGLKAPSWLNNTIYEKIMNISNNGFYYKLYYTETVKLIAGGILNDMYENIRQKIINTKNKLFLYGAHDTHIAALTKLLNISSIINQPPYASAIIVELRESIYNSNDYYIQVYLKNNTASEPIELKKMTIFGCKELCPYDEFKVIIEDLVVTDYSSACKDNFLKKRLEDFSM